MFSKRSGIPVIAAAAAAAVIVLTLAGCGAAKNTSGSGASGGAGKADVAYAGSLMVANEQYVGPAFAKATGDAYQGRGGGAFGVANLIKAGEIQPNVFESIGTAPITGLEPKFTTWAVGFMAQPLVVAYSPHSPFAAQLDAIRKGTKPLADLFTLMENPQFHLGRTNPETDPQGQAFIFMLNLAAQKYKLPAQTVDKIIGSPDNPKQIFAETAILSRLEAGQLDASSAYLPEAVQHHLPYITLSDDINMGNPALAAHYATQSMVLKNGTKITGSPMVVYITTIKGTPDQAAGVSFVKYVLSAAGENLYRQEGYLILNKPVVAGDSNDIPPEIKAELQ